MNLSFKPGRITLVLGPFDMRCGFRKLALAASALLGIDITKGRDYVVFISKNRKIAKVIWCDNAGAFISDLLNRVELCQEHLVADRHIYKRGCIVAERISIHNQIIQEGIGRSLIMILNHFLTETTFPCRSGK